MSSAPTMNGANGVHLNGHSRVSRPLTAGIYAPIPSFFDLDTEDLGKPNSCRCASLSYLDVATFTSHLVRLAQAGVQPVLAGSMGEAHHLSHNERIALIKAARAALDEAGFTTMPIIAGTGAGSTRETVELCKEAASAGADYAIVICSGYFAGALAGNREALKTFWTEVAARSPIPVMIYNYPGAAAGIDLDSDLISELAQECPNLCGVKLTCGNVGKLTRICATVCDPSFAAQSPRVNPDAPFLVLGGFIDFVLPTAYVNAHGAITGLGNVAPYTIKKLFDLSEAARTDPSLLPEARRLQGIVARGDFTIAKANISGTKALLEKLYGYGGRPRLPLPPIEPEVVEALWAHPHTQELVRVERELSGKAKA
ncbi:dihydrodipicolinate synthetase [Epithele typhae]|uniref:dihydrodipicolinate synthetase n=1 Tax=Epithele typhae TaxID=378194 RepID=UPI0020074359|nr:dihydrodipicolinate synthetase [Epithele typhae]KAH9940529.1 dihydrodipicolinate synthetase [Epithele typhae]